MSKEKAPAKKKATKKAATKKKKKPVRFQVKAKRPEGSFVVREFFEEQEPAEAFAKQTKGEHPEYEVCIAAYAKLEDFEPVEVQTL